MTANRIQTEENQEELSKSKSDKSYKHISIRNDKIDFTSSDVHSPPKTEKNKSNNTSDIKPVKKETNKSNTITTDINPVKKETNKSANHYEKNPSPKISNQNMNISPHVPTTKELFNELEKSLNKSIHSHRQKLQLKGNDKSLSRNSSNNNFKVHDISDVEANPNENKQMRQSQKSSPKHKIKNRQSQDNENSNNDVRMDTNPYENDYFPPKLSLRQKEAPRTAQGLHKNSTSKRGDSEKNIQLQLSRRKSEVESFEKVFETYDKSKENDDYKKLLTEGNKMESEKREKYSGN